MNVINTVKFGVFFLIFACSLVIVLRYAEPVFMWQVKNNILSKVSSLTEVGTTVFKTRQIY
tara:strand:+ start:255 stop:437 length:183 start_codon:yes stop_codon:yes gene_type:complete